MDRTEREYDVACTVIPVTGINTSGLVNHSIISGVPGSSPLLRWAGSKKKLLPKLCAATPTHFERYIEPFVGSGVLFLLINPKRAILSDLNLHLVQTYKTIKADAEMVWNTVMTWPATERFYYELREINPLGLDSYARAARFIYLNRYCFNGVYRTNRQGLFNVSRGQGNLGIPDLSIFKGFAARIRKAQIINCDFEKTIDKAEKNDFLYLDPPYAELGKRDRGEYGAGTFKRDDVDRLIKAMHRANDRGVKVLLSYSADQLDLKRLKEWHVHELSVMRNVAGFTGARRTAREVLISNYEWTDNVSASTCKNRSRK
ncbi:Dam family site-specific DNA-(adenine-N6)-methyltransferase [Undibacterium sp. FT79W]|uniref:DNA adenine methylase n=1 Tax=Undibacterium sp. FT79W TaxID=2762296 RepID=UPI00164C641F|nr:Dam family site-specific DNA-(adenine-N6)-methyltransferase [Undibacterium sp. FT79W]MBC3877400.1 Dam family site-specific DNA-(adenine-N6)-methyltransferase [Undibacterium sp. FT79W]